MTEETKPGPEYIFADIPASKERIVAKTAEARVRMTTKAAVQCSPAAERYLASIRTVRHA